MEPQPIGRLCPNPEPALKGRNLNSLALQRQVGSPPEPHPPRGGGAFGQATQPTHRGKPESRPVRVPPLANLLRVAFYLLVHNMTHNEYGQAKHRLEESRRATPSAARRCRASGGPGAR